MSKDGEAILIVPASVRKNGPTEEEIASAAQENEDEAAAVDDDEDLTNLTGEMQLTEAREVVNVQEGSRVEAASVKASRKGKKVKATNSFETKHLHEYATTSGCLRNVWDKFFNNNKKGMKLIFG